MPQSILFCAWTQCLVSDKPDKKEKDSDIAFPKKSCNALFKLRLAEMYIDIHSWNSHWKLKLEFTIAKNFIKRICSNSYLFRDWY